MSISPEAAALRDKFRVNGKFGVQDRAYANIGTLHDIGAEVDHLDLNRGLLPDESTEADEIANSLAALADPATRVELPHGGIVTIVPDSDWVPGAPISSGQYTVIGPGDDFMLVGFRNSQDRFDAAESVAAAAIRAKGYYDMRAAEEAEAAPSVEERIADKRAQLDDVMARKDAAERASNAAAEDARDASVRLERASGPLARRREEKNLFESDLAFKEARDNHARIEREWQQVRSDIQDLVATKYREDEAAQEAEEESSVGIISTVKSVGTTATNIATEPVRRVMDALIRES
jgi:hypothetical protein